MQCIALIHPIGFDFFILFNFYGRATPVAEAENFFCYYKTIYTLAGNFPSLLSD